MVSSTLVGQVTRPLHGKRERLGEMVHTSLLGLNLGARGAQGYQKRPQKTNKPDITSYVDDPHLVTKNLIEWARKPHSKIDRLIPSDSTIHLPNAFQVTHA